MKLSIKCLNCGKIFETWRSEAKFCSIRCSSEYRTASLHSNPSHPIARLAHDYKDYEISKIPEKELTKFMVWSLFELTKLLERNNLKEFCDRYREFSKNNKLCKNCGKIYPSTKRSGSKCPNPECREYNSQRWVKGVEKNKASKLKNWGNGNYNNTKKQIKTMIRRYGVKSPLQMEKSREKQKETCKEKYGVLYPMQSPPIKAKAESTCLKRYGAKNPFQSEGGKAKMKGTLLKKYGVSHANHIGRPNYQNFNANYITQNFIKNNELQESEVKQYFNFKSITPILNLLNKADIPYKRQPKGTRTQRDFFYAFLKEYSVNIEYEKALKPFRVDGFIEFSNIPRCGIFENITETKNPTLVDNMVSCKGLIIEFLGDYWHGKTNDNSINEKCNKSAKELFNQTQERFEILYSMGYIICYIWESDYSRYGLQSLKFFKGKLDG